MSYWKFVGIIVGFIGVVLCVVLAGNLITWSQNLKNRAPLSTEEKQPTISVVISPAPPKTEIVLPQVTVFLPTQPAFVPDRAETKIPEPKISPIPTVHFILGEVDDEPATTTQPTSQPVFYINEWTTTYHVKGCSLTTGADMSLAKPADLATRHPCLICVKDHATAISKYYQLLKNEFMRDEDGFALIPPELRNAILRMRQKAAAEKVLVDKDIADITSQIAGAEGQRRGEVQARRASDADARRHAAQSTYTHVRWSRRGIAIHQHYNGFEADQAASAHQNANAHKAGANMAKSGTRSLIAERMELQQESALLASVGSPYARMLPPKMFWDDLPPAQQDQLSRVGINPSEFKGILAGLGLSQSTFLTAAKIMEKEYPDVDEFIDTLISFLTVAATANENKL